MIGQLLTGRYLVLKQLGVGGFSETYLARDKYLPHHPLCVVKWLTPPSDSSISLETARQLFETEAQILGQLGQQHAQIPTLFAYCCDTDRAYLVQEYIEGVNLGDWVVQGRRLSAEGAIELLEEVLPILDYIHSQQVIHRDIKPSNLIRRHSDGKIVLIDFGAACFSAETGSDAEAENPAIAIGTPGYMPDEQQRGRSQLNSDLYALGMLVIQLLTGVEPSKFRQDLISGELDWQPHLQGQAIAPELLTVLDRLVRAHPHDRYISAPQVLASLQKLTANTRKRKLSVNQWFAPRQQHPLLRRLPMLAGLLLFSVVGGSYWAHVNANTPTESIHLDLLQDVSLPFRVEQMVISPDEQVLVTAGSDQSILIWSLPTEKILKSLSGQTAPITALNISQNSHLLVSGATDQTVRVWDITTEKLISSFVGQNGEITAVAISPDGQTIVSGSQNGVIQFWDLSTQQLLKILTVPNTSITALTYGTTGSQLISASGDRHIQVWDLQTDKLYRTFSGHTEVVIGLQAIDSHTFLSFSEDRTLIWDLRDEDLMQVCDNKTTETRMASFKHERMITVDEDGNVRVWLGEMGQMLNRATATLGRSSEIALSSDHRYLAVWKPDQRLQVWQIKLSESQPGD